MYFAYFILICITEMIHHAFSLAVYLYCHIKQRIPFSYPVILLTSWFAAPAFATCTPSILVNSSIPNFTFNINSIPINGQIGGEFISETSTAVKCLATDTKRYFSVYGTKNTVVTTINGRNIYKTNNPGIGFAFGFEPINFCKKTGTKWMAGGTNNSAISICNDIEFLNADYNYSGRFHYIFYKINQAVINTATILPSSDYGISTEYATLTGTGGSFLSTPISSSFLITAGTCYLQSASITNINLPDMYSHILPNIGSTAGSTPFNIAVNCPSTTRLAITFTDNNNMGQTSNILSPLSTSTAKGVGIQLKYNENIISFGPDSAEPGATNQIIMNGNLTGWQSFPFAASYIRTGVLSPGTLSARATFTLSYQ